MNKGELIDRIAKDNGMTKVVSEKILNSALEVIKRSLRRGEEVKISGFGRWHVIKRKSRLSRNPQTGEMIKIKASHVPAFRCGRQFRGAFR